MPSVKIGARELDLIAARLTDDGNGVAERVHVEVEVPANPIRAHHPDDVCIQGARDYVQRRFSAVEDEVRRLLGG